MDKKQIASVVNTICKYLTISLIVIILILIGAMTGCVTYDRVRLHRQVKEAAINEVAEISRKDSISLKDTLPDNPLSLKEVDHDCKQNDSPIHAISINNSNQCGQDCCQKQSVLDILEKSDGLLNANGLTYIVTLIVALLASLLLYRMEKMETLEKNYEKYKTEVSLYLAHTTKYDNMLSLIKSNYDLAIMIENIAMTLPPKRNKNVLSQIGSLRFRMNINISHIKDRQDNRKTRLDSLTLEQQTLLSTCLSDTLEALQRSKRQNTDVSRLVSGTTNGIEWVEGLVKNMEIIKDTVGAEM